MDFLEFKTGADEYRPLALWSLNHELKEEELSLQISEMARQGMQGFIMHPRSGLLTPYMSERWLCLLEHAVKEAERNGINAWLYDEDPYPSGIAGGRVIADHPEYKAQILGVSKGRLNGPGMYSMDIPLRKIVLAVGVRMENGRIIETKDLGKYLGILRTQWQESRSYHSYYPTTDSKAMPQYRSDTEKPFYRLEWEAPEGEWNILVFHVSQCGKFWLFDSFTDLLNPDAVDYFIQTTYIPYERRFGKYFGNVIPGIFIDEPKFVSSPYPWTGRLPKEFSVRKGYGIEEALIALELDTEVSAERRKDFWEVVGELFNEAYAKQISKWCKKNGLKLIGHNSPEEEPGDQVTITGDLMHFLKYMDIPGTDLITFMIGDRKHPIVNLGPKLASSVSCQWRDGKAMCEAFGVMEWKLNLADMAWIANWLFSLGVNLVSPHTFIYSIDGYRKRDAAPSEFYQAPYWEYLKTWSDYLASLGYMLGDTEPCVHTALVYPFDSFMSLQTIHGSKCNELRDKFVYLFDALLRNHIQFELVDISDLLGADIVNGCLKVGKRSYKRVIIPPIVYLSKGLQKIIGRMMAAGIYTALHLDQDEVYIEGQGKSMKLQDAVVFNEVSERYSITGNAQVGYQCEGLMEIIHFCSDNLKLYGVGAGDVFLKHSLKDGKHVYFLCNTSDQRVDLQFSLGFDREMELEEWNIRNTSRNFLKNNDACSLPGVVLHPRSATFVIASEIEENHILQNKNRNDNSKLHKVTYEKVLEPIWKIMPGKRNLLILNRWVLEKGEISNPADIDFRRGLTVVQPSPAGKCNIPCYPETLWYKAIFNLSGTPEHIGLVMEKSAIRGEYEIFCNGLPCKQKISVREYDCNNIEFPLTTGQLEISKDHFYRKDEIVITVKVKVASPEDGLLEPIRLFGDFLVKLNDGESLGAEIFPATIPQMMSTGSWTHQGYPHFSGTVLYEQNIFVDKNMIGQSCFIYFNIGGDSAEVFVNGYSAGVTAWEPYQVEITDLLKEGSNRIGIKVANTLENLLYGSGKPAGILGTVRVVYSFFKMETTLESHP